MSIFDKFKKKKVEPEQPKKSAPVDIAKEIKLENKEKKKAKLPAVISQTMEVKGKTRIQHYVCGVLIKPLVSEKTTNLSSFNQYAFAVRRNVNKIQIAQAIEGRYGVKPVKVNILNNLGKSVKYGRSFGRTKDWKKAIITLPEGKTIQVQEGV